MKAKTRETVSLIRFIASLLFFIGITIAIGLILAGLFILASRNESYSVLFIKSFAPLMIVGGVVGALWSTLIYSLLNGFAMLIENSDRTQVERALYAIANSVRNSQPYAAPYYQDNNYRPEESFSQDDEPIQDNPQESDVTNDEEP